MLKELPDYHVAKRIGLLLSTVAKALILPSTTTCSLHESTGNGVQMYMIAAIKVTWIVSMNLIIYMPVS